VKRNVLLDTGPLIALLDRHDRYHDWAREQFDDIVPPLLTCEAVLTEACFLARRIDGGPAAALQLFERAVAQLDFSIADHFAAVTSLMDRYANVPMSLADACLVRMTELVDRCTVLTLDSDFRVYRRHKRQAIPLVIPPDVP
jgi:predicted nucleic acid-binding protein